MVVQGFQNKSEKNKRSKKIDPTCSGCHELVAVMERHLFVLPWFYHPLMKVSLPSLDTGNHGESKHVSAKCMTDLKIH
jgi:hypothetical protein